MTIVKTPEIAAVATNGVSRRTALEIDATSLPTKRSKEGAALGAGVTGASLEESEGGMVGAFDGPSEAAIVGGGVIVTGLGVGALVGIGAAVTGAVVLGATVATIIVGGGAVGLAGDGALLHAQADALKHEDSLV